MPISYQPTLTIKDILELEAVSKKFEDNFGELVRNFAHIILKKENGQPMTLCVQAEDRPVMLSGYATDLETLKANDGDFIKTLESYSNGK